MKSRILNVHSYWYPNKYVIAVTRGDGKHIPKNNIYVCDFSNTKRFRSLSKRFLILHEKFTKYLVELKIEELNHA